jgi:transcriptional regulator with XRE-family HTH domain
MFELAQAPGDRATIQLDPFQGEQLRSLIIQNTQENFTRYVERMGLQPANVTNYLSGRNRISMAILQKLLAGTNLKLQCVLQVTITSGNDVNDADCTPLDDLLYSTEPVTFAEDDIMIPHSFPQTTPISSLSEKLQEAKKTTQDSPSKEIQEESSISSGPSLNHHSPTQLPTQSDADQHNSISEEQ